MMNEYVEKFYPHSTAVILTNKCSAACRECCFNCSPKGDLILSDEKIFKFIDEISALGTVKYMVWTGGEAFLLKDRLYQCLQYAKNKGLYSRIVSNGYWATSDEIAHVKLKKLKEAGLAELNISTGDNHQEFVPFDRVMIAALESVRLGISTVISVESNKSMKFSTEDLYKHPLFLKMKEENVDGLLTVISAAWVSFHKDTKYDFDCIEQTEVEHGCNNLFNFVGLHPDGQYIACCGLTLNYLPEMHLGSLDDINLVTAFDNQKKRFHEKMVVYRWSNQYIKTSESLGSYY
ncbi:radical SAM protein [Enterococcus columbae]|uniref:Radical SAM core domain-containing protein n=1 Tax=Enterococcus columbae DSM 7374 = ATCC 51263 TaxID=1121865 RepID=S1P389_9ENTE|nr:radical SAM protein [Enterococcus columbae]EOT44555.1 hypothetical protein OMW_00611 [Enterococcus columbae DSM 7374 = ATCC 51263]EOW87549.1 hypothetical protein I568_00593 [Enterococcus columbae DSM 7374 = ATCC 51263]OJG25206.1 hypothetical protein RR47_GL001994 [Enterococcus columbae DSM 7374 = ATCC 51263]